MYHSVNWDRFSTFQIGSIDHDTATEKTQIETTSNTVEDEANTNNSNTKIYLSSVIF